MFGSMIEIEIEYQSILFPALEITVSFSTLEKKVDRVSPGVETALFCMWGHLGGVVERVAEGGER